MKTAPRTAILLLAALLAACSANYPVQHLSARALAAEPVDHAFLLHDGSRLPYRQWLPPARPQAVVLALHGFNDSADAWELPAPVMAENGIAVIAPDQRGFGAAPDRGRWPGSARMTDDAAEMATQLHARFPGLPLYLMGESMGAAALIQLASRPHAPAVAGYIFSAPAVWGRQEMQFPLRAALWLTNSLAPGMYLSPGPIHVKATDNHAALVRLSTDPRTLTRTRVAAVKGLVDLMTDAIDASPRIAAPALFLYGGHDELVPKHAMAATWRAVASNTTAARFAYYPAGYHLLLRDLHRAAPTDDLIAWIHNPAAPLPSGAEAAAQIWLATQPVRNQPGRPFPPPQSRLSPTPRTRSSAG